MKKRLAPFLMLLDAKYLPLLVAVAPQAYAVYRWLILSGAPEAIATLGAVGYEAIYIGAIAWAEEERWSFWTWATAVVALLFSMSVAYYVYQAQGWWALLHTGFPLVAFCYTMNMHVASAAQVAATLTAPVLTVDDTPLALTKTQQVKALAARLGVSESTAWRKVNNGTVKLEGA